MNKLKNRIKSISKKFIEGVEFIVFLPFIIPMVIGAVISWASVKNWEEKIMEYKKYSDKLLKKEKALGEELYELHKQKNLNIKKIFSLYAEIAPIRKKKILSLYNFLKGKPLVK